MNKILQEFWNKIKSKKQTEIKGQSEEAVSVKSATSALLHTHGFVLRLVATFHYCRVFPPQVIFHGVPTKSAGPRSVEHTLIEFSLKSADSAEREQGEEDKNERERILRKNTRGNSKYRKHCLICEAKNCISRHVETEDQPV